MVSEPLFRHQSASDGPYRAIYDRRRAATATAHPDWTKGHSHADGLRIMTKFLIRDLWNQYRRAIATLPDRAEAVVPAGRRARCSVRKATQAVPAGTDINLEEHSDGQRD